MDDYREYLKGTINLSTSADGRNPEEYTIKSVLGEGGSTICYEAYRKRNGILESGKLKEFYPVDLMGLHRDSEGQLGGVYPLFEERKNDYVETYALLNRAVADDEKNEILKNYIQMGEILYGFSQEKETNGTVYIWTPGIAGKGYDRYIEEIRQEEISEEGIRNPEERMSGILEVALSLTDCMKALHTAGLLYLDIKPSNFLVPYDSSYRIHTGMVSIVDINTIIHARDASQAALGTEGFRAPEQMRGRADNRSDIYSIGALLFYSIVGIYEDTMYGIIPQMVKSSRLISSSEINSDVEFMTILSTILRRTLAKNPRMRYQSCSELKNDLEEAAVRMAELRLTAVRESRTGRIDPSVILQKAVYDHPVYENLPFEEENMEVLIAGAGTYAHRFIDICLQSGQIYGKKLNITCISDDGEEEKKRYLLFRPGIGEFVSIDGSEVSGGAYASLSFLSSGERMGRSVSIQAAILGDALDQRKYTYAFMAYGEDEVNRSLARIASGYMDPGSPILYISYGGETGIEVKNAYPVWINADVTLQSMDESLEQMAFNTHMTWNRSLNVDLVREREKFRKDRYSYEASLAFVLSIRPKLYSVGIQEENLQEAAGIFLERILKAKDIDREAEEKYRRIVFLEHRRWVLEKVTNGWSAPRRSDGSLKIEDIIERGSVKDSRNKTHPCIVHTREDFPLASTEYMAEDKRAWDEGDIAASLDELDRFSIVLHRMYVKEAERLKTDPLPLKREIGSIEEILKRVNSQVRRAFDTYTYAVMTIVYGIAKNNRQHTHYRAVLEEWLEKLPQALRERIGVHLDRIEEMILPSLNSNLYTDYKAIDNILVDRIPHIVSFKNDRHLITGLSFVDSPLDCGMMDDIFSMSVLYPSKSTFVTVVYDEEDEKKAVHSMNLISRYADRRGMNLNMELKMINGLTEDPFAFILPMVDECTIFDSACSVFREEEADRMLLEKLSDAGVSCMRSDSRKGRFLSVNGSKAVEAVGTYTFARALDMVDMVPSIPEFSEDHAVLWKIYSENKDAWMKMAEAIDRWEESRAPVCRIKKNLKDRVVRRIYFIPEYAASAVKRMVEALIEEGAIGDRSFVLAGAGATYRLELYVPEESRAAIDSLFGNPANLLDYYAPYVSSDDGEMVSVWTDDLVMDGGSLDRNLIEVLSDHGFIRKMDENRVMFASPGIKKLFRNENAIALIHLYHTLVESGEYDDISYGTLDGRKCIIYVRGFEVHCSYA